MANFVICLEIRDRTRDYDRLRQLLAKMAAAQVLETVWFASVAGRVSPPTSTRTPGATASTAPRADRYSLA